LKCAILVQTVYVYMQGMLMDCISDVQMVVECVNDDYSGGDEGFPRGCVQTERRQITWAMCCWQEGCNGHSCGGVDRCHAVRVGTHVDMHVQGGCVRLGGCAKHGGGCMRHSGRTRCRGTCTRCHVTV
jgi:hypothetical protein